LVKGEVLIAKALDNVCDDIEIMVANHLKASKGYVGDMLEYFKYYESENRKYMAKRRAEKKNKELI